MIRRHARLGIAAAGLSLLPLGLSCNNVGSDVEVRTSALVGDPIESVTQVQGVAPTSFDFTYFPQDSQSIDSASFTIGLFDEDADRCSPLQTAYCFLPGGGQQLGACPCTLMADFHPDKPFFLGWPYPAFEDVSVVEVAVNVGSAKAMHWDWRYSAYFQQPYEEFWAEVVAQSGDVTTVIDRVGAPDGWGFKPLRPASEAFLMGTQRVDLDLTPWADQRIAVRFSVRHLYDPNFISMEGGFLGVSDFGTAKAYVDNLRVDNCTVQSIELVEIDSPLDANPALGGGKRMFPDKRMPGDQTDRSLVRVVAHMSKPNCPVTFRSLDVDDASGNSVIDPNGAAGGDNNGGAGSCGAFENNDTCLISCGESGGNGCAVSAQDSTTAVTLRASRQPGDNFVVVASADGVALNGVKVGATTSEGPTITDAEGRDLRTQTKIKATPMLTVWRRLHIELDSMGPVTANHERGRIVALNPSSPTTLRLALSPALTPLNRFERGRIVVGSISLPVISSDARTVIIADPGASISNRLFGASFLLYDDDDFNLNDGTGQRGDEGEDIPEPDMRLMTDADNSATNVFFDAYVRPTYDLGRDGAVRFVLNGATDTPENIQRLFAFDNRGTEADADFWTIYLLGAYQPEVDECNDPPGASRVTFGASDAVGGMGAAIFLESLRDHGVTTTDNPAVTVVHEVGHLFGLEHAQGGVMGDDDLGFVLTETIFSPTSIVAIRSALHP